jgi:YD repeat-containing protein
VAGMNDNAQWIVMLGFIISIILIFLALIVNQSALIGKTTAESVLEFPKTDIQDARAEILEYFWNGTINQSDLQYSLQNLSMEGKGSILWYHYNGTENSIAIHYNDGLTEYNEMVRAP